MVCSKKTGSHTTNPFNEEFLESTAALLLVEGASLCFESLYLLEIEDTPQFTEKYGLYETKMIHYVRKGNFVINSYRTFLKASPKSYTIHDHDCAIDTLVHHTKICEAINKEIAVLTNLIKQISH